MKNKKLSIITYSLIIIIVICLSIVYRVKFYKDYDYNYKTELNQKNKIVVNLWIKKSDISTLRKYQIEKFNESNKDNIYIILKQYGKDYYNALRTTLASGNQSPDIFQYGFNTLIKNKKIASLNDINFDKSKVDASSIIKYENTPLGVKLTDTNVKMIWNKEIFKNAGLNPDNPPKTWDEIIDYSLKIKSKVPGVTCFGFPLKNTRDMHISIGEPSVNSGNIYTSFWNYKEGKYDFSYSKNIIEIYNKMYKMNLIENNFDKNSSERIKSQFAQGNIAMMISTFDDKSYFSNVVPLNFPMGIQNVAQVGKNKNQYYYIENNDFLVINKESLKKNNKKNAINKVYEYLLSENVNNQVIKTKYKLPLNLKNANMKNDIYNGYNDVNNFYNANLDPTIFLDMNSESYEVNLFVDAIKGKIMVNSAIANLNNKYQYYYNSTVNREKFDFKYYKK